MAKITLEKEDIILSEEDIKKKISTAKTLEDIDVLEDYLYTSKHINRRLKRERERIMQLSSQLTKVRFEIIERYQLVPF